MTKTNIDWVKVEQKLEAEARLFLMDAYGLELSVPVKVNGRFKNLNGRFRYENNKPFLIEIGKTYYQYQDWEHVHSTLKHECIHYALYVLGKPHKDGDDYFEAELKKWGSHSTGTVRYRGMVEQYACSKPKCVTIYRRKRKLPHNGKYYVSGCCDASLKYLGKKEV